MAGWRNSSPLNVHTALFLEVGSQCQHQSLPLQFPSSFRFMDKNSVIALVKDGRWVPNLGSVKASYSRVLYTHMQTHAHAQAHKHILICIHAHTHTQLKQSKFFHNTWRWNITKHRRFGVCCCFLAAGRNLQYLCMYCIKIEKVVHQRSKNFAS